jgi:glucose-specific phosphotransferase system IIA component
MSKMNPFQRIAKAFTNNKDQQHGTSIKQSEVRENAIYSPMQGRVLPLEQVPDETFAAKMLGDGFAVEPQTGELVAPVNGTITLVFDTKHAIGIKTDSGIELLIHVGIDTVKMKGEGFNVKVKMGDRVKVGDPILKVDLNKVKQKAKSLITPVVITNMKLIESVQLIKTGDVNIVDHILDYKLKE